MKKWIFTTLLILTAGSFVACQKEEQKEEQNQGYGSNSGNSDAFSFYGTWSGESTVTEYDDGDKYTVNYKVTLTLSQDMSYSFTFATKYTDPDGETEEYGDSFDGTYSIIDNRTIDLDDGEFILVKKGNNLYLEELDMTLTKSGANKGADTGEIGVKGIRS